MVKRDKNSTKKPRKKTVSNNAKRKNNRLTKIVSYFLLITFLFYGLFQATTTLHLDSPIEYTIQGHYSLLDAHKIKEMIEKENGDRGYLLLDTNYLTQKFQETKIYKKVKIEKQNYRHVLIFVEEKEFMLKQKQATGEMITFDENGDEVQLSIPTNIPLADPTMSKADVKKIATAFSKQSTLLLQSFSEVTYSFVGEVRKEIKIITVSGDSIFIKLDDIEQKLMHFLEIDTLMNKKNITHCEYHFEYTDANVVVKEIK